MKKIVPIIALLTCFYGFSQTIIGGTVSTNTTYTLANSPYEVTSSLAVNAGVTLTIESGVEIRFNDNFSLTVNGILDADGVTFTSSNASPTAGDWFGIFLNGNNSNTLTNCQVLYARKGVDIDQAVVDLSGSSFISSRDYGVFADHSNTDVRNDITANNVTITGAGIDGIYIDRANLTLSNSTISGVGNYGILFEDNQQGGETVVGTSSVSNTSVSDGSQGGIGLVNGTISFTDLTVSNSYFPVRYLGSANASYSGTTSFTNNDFEAILFTATTIDRNITLPDAGYPYYFNGAKTINNGIELIIESGSIIKLAPNVTFSIEGKLTADAETGEDIIFTSWYDDNVSGDTNGDSNDTAPGSNGQWYGIHFQEESDDASSISGATLKWVRFYGAIRTSSASPTIDNNFITNCYYGGEFLGASSPTFSNNEIAASERTPIAMTLDANPIFSNNSFSSSDNEYDAIGLLGSVLTRDNVLPQRNFTDIDNVTYVLLGSVDIPVGTSLTINPGVVIKSESGYNIEVQGELIADGTIAEGRIIFTSINDDNYGNPLDTRNDGTNQVPAVGNFGGIYFGENAESTSLLDSVLIKFANYSPTYQDQYTPTNSRRVFGYDAAIAINRSEPTISNTEISDAKYGIDMRGLASPALTANEIKNTEFAPFRQAIQTTPIYSENTFSSVGWKGVAILPELINYTATLSKQTVAGYDNILYIITDLDINEGAQITIEEGIYIKMDSYDYIEVFGGLNIAGTSENPVTITTMADDNTGPFTDPLDNDTQGNGNATDPTTSEWASIIFYEMSDDGFSNISHTNLLYGGIDRAPIWWQNAAASIDNVDISFSQTYGLYFEGASTPTIDNVSISTSRLDPLAMSYFADPTFTNITFNANGSNGINLIDTQLNADATVAKRDIAGINNIGYVMNNLTIDNGATLTINPGVVMKFSGNGINVYEGAINAVGTPTEKIIFTSISDDSRGGDTNIDGNGTAPAPNNWYGLAFRESTLQSQLQYAEIRYGGDAQPSSGSTNREREGTIISYNNNLFVDNCIVQLTASSAFGAYGTSTATFTNNTLENVARFPVHLSMFSNPTFSGNTVENVTWFALGLQDESYNLSATFPFRSFAGVDSVTYYPTAVSGATMTINSGTKITVPPGMHFKTTSEQIFEINGELHIAGTAEDPVVFTELADDDYGRPRDTQSNGLPTSISWHGKVFDFNNISDDASLIEYAIVRYKDRTATLESASPTFDNNLMEYANWGITSTGISEPIYTNNTFRDLSFTPFATSLVAYPATTSGNVLEGTTWKAIQINDETLTQDTTLYKRSFGGISNIPYAFHTYTVGLGVKMTIEPGVILKFHDTQRAGFSGSDGSLTVQGALEANGGASSDETIVFTSMNDDFFGGDTNSDSTQTTSIYSDFEYIRFTNESSDSESILNNVIIRGADSYGVELQSASPTITNTLFWENGSSSNNGGLYITGASNPTLSNNDFIDNSYLSGTTVQGYGINNTGTFTIDATGSWWGDNSGPYHTTLNIEGEGDQVLGNVTFDPWGTDNSINPITGDVSLNGRVSAFDAALTLQDVAAVITFEARQDRAGDVSGDGTISAMDASYILQFSAGIIQSFPAEAENKRIDEVFASTHSEVILAIGNGDINSAYGEVSLPITVSNVKELYALSMSLPLGDHLSFSAFKVNEELTFSPTVHYNELDNAFNLAFGLMTGLKEDFVLGTLTLSLNAEKVPVSSITLLPTKLVGNETNISSAAEPGQIYLAGAVLGNNELANGISVYPNPTVSHAIVSMPELTQEEVNVQIVDVSGKVMIYGQKPIGEDKLVLSNLQLNPGIYIIRVVGDTKQFEQQLIISQ